MKMSEFIINSSARHSCSKVARPRFLTGLIILMLCFSGTAAAAGGQKATIKQLNAEAVSRAAADSALQNNIDNISLTPGPQGPVGPQGPAGANGADSTVAGPAGPQGPAGLGAVIFNTAPTASDDMNTYSLGSVWIDTSAGNAYILVDGVPGAAVWKLITEAAPLYAIGDTGPAGGIVFYVTAGGAHGLEAAPNDSLSAQWGCYNIPVNGADGTAIGTGQQNTADILAAGCPESPIAAGVANTFINGSLGWFLPSKNELNELYLNRAIVGGFLSNLYWSSSEFDADFAWVKEFGSLGVPGISDKRTIIFNGVRAVRAF
jgi:hypothetical protein